MYRKTLALVLGFASFTGVLSQTTAAIFPGDQDGLDGVEGLAGEIAGTGADGTTYIISLSVSGVAATATLVEDATHLSEFLEVATSSVTVKVNEECGYDSDHVGACTAVLEANQPGLAIATTATASGTITLNPVALTTAKSAAASTSSFAAIPLVATLVSGITLLIVV